MLVLMAAQFGSQFFSGVAQSFSKFVTFRAFTPLGARTVHGWLLFLLPAHHWSPMELVEVTLSFSVVDSFPGRVILFLFVFFFFFFFFLFLTFP